MRIRLKKVFYRGASGGWSFSTAALLAVLKFGDEFFVEDLIYGDAFGSETGWLQVADLVAERVRDLRSGEFVGAEAVVGSGVGGQIGGELCEGNEYLIANSSRPMWRKSTSGISSDIPSGQTAMVATWSDTSTVNIRGTNMSSEKDSCRATLLRFQCQIASSRCPGKV
jgi:hypothetical protein